MFYTNNRLTERIAAPVRERIALSGLPIASVSLAPLDFGRNITLERQPSAVTLFTQILTGMEASDADVVFLAEHDVMYHQSHWEFLPPRDDTFYYNVNVWRWDYPTERAITYDALRSLSGLCASRRLLIDHYLRRLKAIDSNSWQDGRDPGWARRIGYEPGKARKRGGLSDERLEDWRSPYPNVDIRHDHTLTPRKVTLDSFRHPPMDWREATLDQIPGWSRECLTSVC